MLAILFEVLQKEIPEEIHHFAGWEGGELKWRQKCEQTFVNKLAFPKAIFQPCAAEVRPICHLYGIDLRHLIGRAIFRIETVKEQRERRETKAE